MAFTLCIIFYLMIINLLGEGPDPYRNVDRCCLLWKSTNHSYSIFPKIPNINWLNCFIINK
jgi:hypothetical protein